VNVTLIVMTSAVKPAIALLIRLRAATVLRLSLIPIQCAVCSKVAVVAAFHCPSCFPDVTLQHQTASVQVVERFSKFIPLLSSKVTQLPG